MSPGAGWSVAVTAVINTSLLWIRLFLVESFSIQPEVSYIHRLTGFSPPPVPLSFAIRSNPLFCSVSSRNLTWKGVKMSCARAWGWCPKICVLLLPPVPMGNAHTMQICPLCSPVLLRREARCCNPLVSLNTGRIFVFVSLLLFYSHKPIDWLYFS